MELDSTPAGHRPQSGRGGRHPVPTGEMATRGKRPCSRPIELSSDSFEVQQSPSGHFAPLGRRKESTQLRGQQIGMRGACAPSGSGSRREGTPSRPLVIAKRYKPSALRPSAQRRPSGPHQGTKDQVVPERHPRRGKASRPVVGIFHGNDLNLNIEYQ